MASELPPNASQTDIEQELIFTKVLIDSLDHDADGYEDQVSELEGKVAELEGLLGLTPESASQQSGLDYDLSSLDAFEAEYDQIGSLDGAGDLPDGMPTHRECALCCLTTQLLFTYALHSRLPSLLRQNTIYTSVTF
jgi:hypothetical protein